MRFPFLILLLLAPLTMAGCNATSELFDGIGSSKKSESPTPVVQENARLEPKRLTSKGGTRIVATVNGQPVTSSAIRRRAAFLKLRRAKGNHTKLATEELVNEAVQMQEARRRGRVVSDKAVDAAYARFAQRNKMPVKVLGQILDRSGVTRRGFKQYIKAQMTWQSMVGARMQAQEGGGSRPRGPLEHLHGGQGQSSRTTEYTVQQVVFVDPKSGPKPSASARMSQANAFRSQFAGCDTTIAKAAQLKNVTVIDRGRVQLHELPPRWSKEIKSTSAGKMTRPLKTEKGLELMAVCRTREVLSKNDQAGGDLFAEKAPATDDIAKAEKEYLDELKERATIIYR